jgi:alpha-N-acetylglucosaminidase
MVGVVQVTQFGPPSSGLNDYSYRLWGGLLSSFYAQRWKQWGDGVGLALLTGKPYNQTEFNTNVTAWELEWTQTIAANLTVNGTGNPFELSQKLYSNWFGGNGTMRAG